MLTDDLFENTICNPFVSVRMRFVSVVHTAMSVSHSTNALLVGLSSTGMVGSPKEVYLNLGDGNFL